MGQQKPNEVSVELLQEFLECIAESNAEQIKNRDILNGIFQRENIVKVIKGLSTKLGLCIEAKFLSIALYDKFMGILVKEIKKHMTDDPNKNWDHYFKLLKSQALLRVLSSIQLASKVCSSHAIIKCPDVRRLLGELGYNFNLVSIMNSELRIMKYLDYKLNLPTPYNIMEILLEILSRNLPDSFEPTILKMIGIKVLECFMYQRDNIYDRLYESMTGRARHILDREKFLVIESNYLYLAASVIVAAAYIHDHLNKKTYDIILDSIVVVTKMDKDDLDEFSVILCHFSLEQEDSSELKSLNISS